EASILSLYDQERLTSPRAGDKKISWEDLDQAIKSGLNATSQVRIVSNTILSPTTKQVIADFQTKFPNTQHITYDAQSFYGMQVANQKAFGTAAIPSYDFSGAKVIVSLAADFLGTWLAPTEFINQYAERRKVSDKNKDMSRHYQFESNLSVTGANADYRTPVRASQQGLIAGHLYNLVATKAGGAKLAVPAVEVAWLEKAAENLWANKGASIVVSGSNDPDVQLVVNGINQLLGNYGKTIDLDTPVYYRQGNDQAMNNLITELGSGRVDAVIFFNANPVYDYPNGAGLKEALANVKLKVATNDRMDETAILMDYVAPDHHYLESWNDANPKKGVYSLVQPGITPIFQTRQAQKSLLTWAGSSDTDYYSYLQESWKSRFASQIEDFQTFWDKSLYDGVLTVKEEATQEATNELTDTTSMDLPVASVNESVNLSGVGANLTKNYTSDSQELELVLYQKVGIGNGSHSNNPWLHEMPDPITKVCWDNYITVSRKFAIKHNIKMVDRTTVRADLTVDGKTLNLPIVVQPGQADGTVGLALGYGRKNGGRVANGVGADAYPLMGTINDVWSLDVTSDVSVTPTKVKYRVAQTQTSHTFMGRETVIQETNLTDYQENSDAGRYHPKIATWKGDEEKVAPKNITLWKHYQQDYTNHHWGMVIDLNSCTGCGTCTIACQVENNVPVVGRQEVINRREMHWIRIDRYYASEGAKDIKTVDLAAENPEVTFQPMMCQHCNNAPCETVCPVAATTHSTEGLNQMAYNRCIGTRYCANNCPYKVRRFNWFKYHDNDEFVDNSSMNNSLGRMVLNPDVTVRSRGVMEKCTMCVQRIQAGKLVAKKEGRRLSDRDANTACASACPANAIVFGDMNNPESKISRLLQIEQGEKIKTIGESRAYTVLEEINVDPNVFYLTKVRNKDNA
ncbi:MAG: 4Fe-4S dicluster domain-containing protein, partial [Cyclobacteriaceae bacterium]